MEQEPRPFKSFVGLLKPLGKPVQNSVKYFATADLEGLRQDVRWLGRATDAVQARWRRKNGASGGKRRIETAATAA